MTKYQLAKLIQLSGGIESRKRIQKTVHLLQAAGCPFNVDDFRIHYYGPYSKSLARLTDELSNGGLLEETSSETQLGLQYAYAVTPEAVETLAKTEKTPFGLAQMAALRCSSELLEHLNKTPPRVLELASTIVGFTEAGASWEKALNETISFKKESEDSRNMQEAKKLAERILNGSDGSH